MCKWRIQEGLADSFEAMNLIEDALIQYDELEASFFQSLKGNPGSPLPVPPYIHTDPPPFSCP